MLEVLRLREENNDLRNKLMTVQGDSNPTLVADTDNDKKDQNLEKQDSSASEDETESKGKECLNLRRQEYI